MWFNDRIYAARDKFGRTPVIIGKKREAYCATFESSAFINLGYKYVSGGKKPETGFDCSGFTRYVFSNFGVSLGATAASQANNSGTEVARTDLQVGDLILFQDDGRTRIGHCGIYIGNNTCITHILTNDINGAKINNRSFAFLGTIVSFPKSFTKS